MLYEKLFRFMNWYKGRCTFEMRKINTKFSWQPRFHEHVIRNEKAYLKIAKYIQNNPLRWQEDKYYASSILTLGNTTIIRQTCNYLPLKPCLSRPE